MDKQTLIRLLTEKLHDALFRPDERPEANFVCAGEIRAYETALELVRQLPDWP